MRAPAEDDSFSAFPNENFLDLRLCQYGWEQCAPMHFFGPYVRSHYLFHCVISGRGHLDATGASGARRALHGVQLKDFYNQEAINCMEHNYQREISVEELADVCKLNRSYFSKLFKESTTCKQSKVRRISSEGSY